MTLRLPYFLTRWFGPKPRLTEPTEAQRAHFAAVTDLARTESRTAEVRRVSASLREWRERNHVVDQLDRIFYGGHAS